MEDEIVVNRAMLKAIGADTRIRIMKCLGQRQKTQSELAKELSLSAPTVLEHLDSLASAGLVEKVDTGRKWKYYKLTRLGNKMTTKSRINVVIVLALSLIAVFGSLIMIFSNIPVYYYSGSFESSAQQSASGFAGGFDNDQQKSQEGSQLSYLDVPSESESADSGDNNTPEPESGDDNYVTSGSEEYSGVGSAYSEQPPIYDVHNKTAENDSRDEDQNQRNGTITNASDASAGKTENQNMIRLEMPLELGSIYPYLIILGLGLIILGVSLGYLFSSKDK